MNFRTSTYLKITILALVILTSSFCKLFAQTGITVKTSGKKTNISVVNFPKNSTVLIVDENLNLLSIASTNEDGMATVTLNKSVKTTIIAKTIHGDFEVSTKDERKLNNQSQMAVTDIASTIKA